MVRGESDEKDKNQEEDEDEEARGEVAQVLTLCTGSDRSD